MINIMNHEIDKCTIKLIDAINNNDVNYCDSILKNILDDTLSYAIFHNKDEYFMIYFHKLSKSIKSRNEYSMIFNVMCNNINYAKYNIDINTIKTINHKYKYFILGKYYMLNGNYKKAVRYFKLCKKINTDLEIDKNLGYSYNLNKFNKARYYFKKFIQKDITNKYFNFCTTFKMKFMNKKFFQNWFAYNENMQFIYINFIKFILLK